MQWLNLSIDKLAMYLSGWSGKTVFRKGKIRKDKNKVKFWILEELSIDAKIDNIVHANSRWGKTRILLRSRTSSQASPFRKKCPFQLTFNESHFRSADRDFRFRVSLIWRESPIVKHIHRKRRLSNINYHLLFITFIKCSLRCKSHEIILWRSDLPKCPWALRFEKRSRNFN